MESGLPVKVVNHASNPDTQSTLYEISLELAGT